MIAKRLAAMFEADRNMELSFWFKQFPAYEFDAQAGARPWWPPLSEVWYHQGEPPPHDGTAGTAHWGEAWDLLQRLHADYQASKR
jgi:hypothetical protein